MNADQIDRERAAALASARKKHADNDVMLHAYGRYWLPVATRIADALEKIEAHLAILAGQAKPSAKGKAKHDDK